MVLLNTVLAWLEPAFIRGQVGHYYTPLDRARQARFCLYHSVSSGQFVSKWQGNKPVQMHGPRVAQPNETKVPLKRPAQYGIGGVLLMVHGRTPGPVGFHRYEYQERVTGFALG
ncbi:hypothetical protein GCM10011363_36430 [Marivita lacus]|uniref:Uncharacterized protein n=1 Tax=Marivita lacus TaxID=1323742 RepID=A0ABQ1L694_9RHOB|nr:hypothetical protein GCM10011363_36430 [Marivita lacus]